MRYVPEVGQGQEVDVHQQPEARQAEDVYVAVGYVTRQANAICKGKKKKKKTTREVIDGSVAYIRFFFKWVVEGGGWVWKFCCLMCYECDNCALQR